jgi:hypothetical protein
MTTPTPSDLTNLTASYLTPEIVTAAQIQRVDSIEGAEIVGRQPRNGHDYAGLIFPYLWPGESNPREFRLRRDQPDLEQQPDGSVKEKGKYLAPPGKANLLYFPPDIPADWLTNPAIPCSITEGEKKALALARFYADRGEKRLVIGLCGVWNWRGTTGKITNTNGKRQSVHGVISDFDRIEWKRRETLIVFDTNVLTNEDVAAARRELARELTRRGSIAHWVNLPTGISGVNGVDDLLARCGPDFVAGLFVNSVNSVIEAWELPSPFDEYDLPEFPLDALPDWLGKYVEGLATATQTPVDLPAMLALANISAAIAGRVAVRVREDWMEPTNAYLVVIQDVGSRKTAVHDATQTPLEEVEHQLIRDTQSKIDDAKVERDMLAARLEHLKKAAGKADSPDKRKKLLAEAKEIAEEFRAVEVPAIPKLIASGDITPEAIASNLADQDGRLFLSSDEGELFQLLAGRYGNGANFEIVLKAHTGGKVRVDRRGRSEIVESATLTIGMTVQPDVLRGVAENPAFRGRGLTARFLYALPKSLVGRRKSTPEPLSDEAQHTYTKRVKTLAGLSKVVKESGELEPKIVKLSADARDYLTAFMDEIEQELREGGELRPIADWATKLAGAVARLATILHYAEHSFEPNSISEIPAMAVSRAIKIGRYLIPHARAAYAEMGADIEIEKARHLLRWIRREKSAGDSTFTKRDAHRANAATFKKVTELEPALNLLEAHGYIRAVARDGETSRAGRKSSQVFEINPAVWRADIQKTNPTDRIDTIDTIDATNENPLTEKPDSVNSVNSVIESETSHSGPVNGYQPAAVLTPGATAATNRRRVSL